MFEILIKPFRGDQKPTAKNENEFVTSRQTSRTHDQWSDDDGAMSTHWHKFYICTSFGGDDNDVQRTTV